MALGKVVLALWSVSVSILIVLGGLDETTAFPEKLIAVCREDVLLSAKKAQNQNNNGIFANEWEIPTMWMSTNETTNFTLAVFEPKCRSNSIRHLDLRANESEEYLKNHTRLFFPNGYFQYSRHIYAPDEYCIKSFVHKHGVLDHVKMQFCKPDCAEGKKRACIKKCCPLYQIFSGVLGKLFCVDLPPGSVQFAPPFHYDFYSRVETTTPADEENYIVDIYNPFPPDKPLPHYKYQSPKFFRAHCKDNVVISSPTSEKAAQLLSERFGIDIQDSPPFRVRSDGAIMYKSLENKCDTLSYRWDHFCVDGVRGALGDLDSPFNNTEGEYIIFQCQVPEKEPHLDKYLSSTFGTLLLATSIFPLITCVVYILLWKRQNLHGWTIAATSGSLFLMYVFQGTAHVIGVVLHEAALNTFYCQLIGILTHFFMMSTFTWCTVMSCDLWLTFRSVVPMNQQRLQAMPRFLKYSTFGWGVPTVIVAIGILMDFVINNSKDCSYHPVPAYGQRSCWIVENSLGVYLYYPALLLIIINIGLFAATCIKLCMYGKGSNARSRSRCNNDAFGECFSRFTKLFCVMGISWIFEIISWLVDGLGYVWYWNIFDVFNILRAVVVFIIYVCKKDVIHQLEDVYPSLKCVFRPFSRLLLRKCSDEMNAESTVLSQAAAVTTAPSSPGIPLKAVNSSSGGHGHNDNKRTGNEAGNRLDIPNSQIIKNK